MSNIRKTIYNIFFVNLILCIVFSVIYKFVFVMDPENSFNGLDKDSNFIDFFYFATTTTSTIGYGDISPKSNIARAVIIIHQLLVMMNLANLVYLVKS